MMNKLKNNNKKINMNINQMKKMILQILMI